MLAKRDHRLLAVGIGHAHKWHLPLHGYDQNQIWCEIVALASELLAWTAMLALTGTARLWEPKKLRLRLFSTAGHRVRGGRRVRLRLAARWPWSRDITRRHQPSSRSRTRLTRTPQAHAIRKEKPQGPWNPAHPARQPGRRP